MFFGVFYLCIIYIYWLSNSRSRYFYKFMKFNHNTSWADYYPIWLQTYFRYTQNDRLSVQHMEDTMAKLAPILNGLCAGRELKLLELGIGSGAMAQAVCGPLSIPCRIFGMEIQPEMVEQARKRLGYEATIMQGDVFALPLQPSLRKALPADILLMTHVAYFAMNGQKKRMRPYTKLRSMLGLLRATLFIIRPCLGKNTVGIFMHFTPVSSYLQNVLSVCRIKSYALSTYTYRITYPRIDDQGWLYIEQGAIDSLSNVSAELKPVQDMQHLIEISIRAPLKMLSHARRKSIISWWRDQLITQDYVLKRHEQLSIVTRYGALANFWSEVKTLFASEETKIIDCNRA